MVNKGSQIFFCLQIRRYCAVLGITQERSTKKKKGCSLIYTHAQIQTSTKLDIKTPEMHEAIYSEPSFSRKTSKGKKAKGLREKVRNFMGTKTRKKLI